MGAVCDENVWVLLWKCVVETLAKCVEISVFIEVFIEESYKRIAWGLLQNYILEMTEDGENVIQLDLIYFSLLFYAK